MCTLCIANLTHSVYTFLKNKKILEDQEVSNTINNIKDMSNKIKIEIPIQDFEFMDVDIKKLQEDLEEEYEQYTIQKNIVNKESILFSEIDSYNIDKYVESIINVNAESVGFSTSILDALARVMLKIDFNMIESIINYSQDWILIDVNSRLIDVIRVYDIINTSLEKTQHRKIFNPIPELNFHKQLNRLQWLNHIFLERLDIQQYITQNNLNAGDMERKKQLGKLWEHIKHIYK